MDNLDDVILKDCGLWPCALNLTLVGPWKG
jgi:hypothetical protein